MPKRVAEDYITKDHGSIANPGFAEQKPAMSTAAQMAKRKIAQPKTRLGSNRPSNTSFGNAFNTNQASQQQQQQTFGSVNGGMVFGASQSFPPGITPPGGDFNFQAPQSSSFTFGAPPSGTSNPFTTVNGNANSGNNDRDDDVSMQSPRKKHAAVDVFGSSNKEINMNSGFTFGQQAQPQANGGFSFGAAQSNNTNTNTNTNGGGLFDRVKAPAPEESAQTNSPFGQPAQPQQSIFGGFGQAAPATQSQTPTFAFGQSTFLPKSQEATMNVDQALTLPKSQEPAFNFGQNNNNNFATPSQGFKFNPVQTNTNEQNQTPTFTFGQIAPQSQAPKFSFGSPDAAPASQSPNVAFGSTSQSSPFAFGQPQLSPSPPINNSPFAGFGAPQNQQSQSPASIFGNNAGNVQTPTEAVAPPDLNNGSGQNTFGGVFGQSNHNAQNATPGGFGFGGPAQPQETSTNNPQDASQFKRLEPSIGLSEPEDTTMSSRSPDTSREKTQETNEDTTLNSQREAMDRSSAIPPNALAQQSKPSASGSLFSPAASSNQSTGTNGGLFGKESTPAKPLFTFAKLPLAEIEPSQDDSGSTSSATPKPALTSKSALDLEATPTQKSKTTSLFGRVSHPKTQKEHGSQTNQSSSVTKPSASQSTSQPTSQIAKAGQFVTPSTTQAETPAATQTTWGAQNSKGALKRIVYTKAAPIIPGHLEAEQYREYDRNYRLHSLNLGLQQTIIKMNPRIQDFDSLIRHYVAARESIGESLGLYERSVAGMKRKGGHIERLDDRTSQNKRQRSEGASQSISTASTPSESIPSAFDLTKPAATTDETNSSKAREMFKGMLPGSKSALGSSTTETSPKDANPFGISASFTPKPSTSAVTTSSFTGFTPASNSTSSLLSKPHKDNSAESIPPEVLTFTPATSTTPTKSPPKKPTFEVPKFGGGNTNFMAAFGQQAKQSADKLEKSLKEKRKAEDFDSDDDDEEMFNKQLEEENRAKRAKIDAIAKRGFTPSFGVKGTTEAPKPLFNFGSTSAASNAPAQSITPAFGGFKPSNSNANPFAAFTSTKPSSEESDLANDEDDDDTSEHDEEGERGDGDYEDEGESSGESEEDQEEEDLPEDEVQEEIGHAEEDSDEGSDENDLQKAMARSRRRQPNNSNAGKSLFDRIEPNPNRTKEREVNGTQKEASPESTSPILESAKNSSFKPGLWGSHIGHSTPEKPAFSPFTPNTPQSSSTYKPATTFNFTPPPATTATPTPGASIFAGGFTKDGPVPGEGMFGSRPSTPSNAEKPGATSNLAKSVLASPANSDNTWKQGDPISFGTGTKAAPTFKFTAPSPFGGKDSAPLNQFGTLFGSTGSDSKSSEPVKLGFNFGASTSSPAPGFLGAVSHLGGGSAASSAVSSRATSPGLTDNESVATNDSEDAVEDPQTSLMDSRAGEENETCLWEGRSKALMFVNEQAAKGTKLKANDWNSMGVGQVRVLQDKTTNKTRVVFRVEPSASILINSHLVESTNYESVPSTKSGSVKGTLFYKGNLTRWVFKVKTPEMADTLAKVLEDNKKA